MSPLSQEQFQSLASLGEEIRRTNAQEQHERDVEVICIWAWICPAKGCGNYYASSSQQQVDLSREFTGPKCEDRAALAASSGSVHKHSRAACPDCRARGVATERVHVPVQVTRPATGPPTPRPPTNLARDYAS